MSRNKLSDSYWFHLLDDVVISGNEVRNRRIQISGQALMFLWKALEFWWDEASQDRYGEENFFDVYDYFHEAQSVVYYKLRAEHQRTWASEKKSPPMFETEDGYRMIWSSKENGWVDNPEDPSEVWDGTKESGPLVHPGVPLIGQFVLSWHLGPAGVLRQSI